MHRHAIRQLTNRACFLAARSGRYVSAPYANRSRMTPPASLHWKSLSRTSTASRETDRPRRVILGCDKELLDFRQPRPLRGYLRTWPHYGDVCIILIIAQKKSQLNWFATGKI